MEQEPLPGWYPDPEHPGEERYWTGDRWSSFRRHTEEPAPPPPVRGSPAYQQAQRHHRLSGRRGRARRYVIFFVILAVVVIAIIAAIVATSSNSPGSGTKTHPAAADVSLSTCSVGPTLNLPRATGKIVNHSSGTSDYSFTVSFFNKLGEVAARGSGAKNHVAPQQTAAWIVMGDTPNDGPLTCRLEAVSRFASR